MMQRSCAQPPPCARPAHIQVAAADEQLPKLDRQADGAEFLEGLLLHERIEQVGQGRHPGCWLCMSALSRWMQQACFKACFCTSVVPCQPGREVVGRAVYRANQEATGTGTGGGQGEQSAVVTRAGDPGVGLWHQAKQARAPLGVWGCESWVKVEGVPQLVSPRCDLASACCLASPSTNQPTQSLLAQ